MSRRKKCVKRGERDQFVTIYGNAIEPTANPDGQIVEKQNTIEIGQWWAKVLPVSGRGSSEGVVADQMQGHVTHVGSVVYDDKSRTIKPDMWMIKEDGTRLNITRAYDPTQQRRDIEMQLVEKVTPWV